MPITKTYLGWDKPVSRSAAERIVSLFSSGSFLNSLNLSEITIVVPTRQSGRLLTDELLRLCDENGRILFPPRIITPMELIEIRPGTADRYQEIAAMLEALSACSELEQLFPTGIPSEEAGRYESAKMLCSLRTALSENGLTFEQVAANPLVQQTEPLRWNDLVTLEKEYLRVLAQKGLADRTAELVRGSEEVCADGHCKIIVVSVPDPTPLAAAAMEKLASGLEMEIWINAPESAAGSFDQLGRPLEEAFAVLPEIHPANITIVRKPADAAEKAVQILSRLEALSADRVGIALFSNELVKPFENSFEKYGCKVYDPSGESVMRSVPGDMISNLLGLVTQGDYNSLSRLLRNPHLLHFLFTDHKKKSDFLRELDTFHDETLPFTAEAVYSRLKVYCEDYPLLKEGIDRFTELLSQSGMGAVSQGSQVPHALRAFLKIVYTDPMPCGSSFDPQTLESQMKKIASELNLLSQTMASFKLGLKAAVRIIGDTLNDARVYSVHEPQAVALQGWLEMSWTGASVVILSGFNEGMIPESVSSDAFLPEKLRRNLGLKSNSKRLARDRFLLHALVKSRKENLHITVLKSGDDNTMYKPSRLLFACDEDTLVERARYLFGENSPQTAASGGALERFEYPFIKPPEPVKTPERLSVTSFKSYLQCPFRFYLSRILKMEPAGGDALEMDAMTFGTICHRAVETYGKVYKSIGREADDIAEVMVGEAKRAVEEKYGSRLSLALAFQLENICNRLKKVAAVEAQNRTEKWEIVSCESSYSMDVMGVRVDGKIDRIEYNPDLDLWRVLDFKTSSRAADPLEAHLSRKDADPASDPGVMVPARKGTEFRKWVDLQIPLYIKLLEQNRSLVVSAGGQGFDPSKVIAGYFNMPDELTQTGIILWDGLNGELVRKAFDCCEKVVEKIMNRVFWPPAENVEYDDLDVLYVEDILGNVDGCNLEKIQEERSNK